MLSPICESEEHTSNNISNSPPGTATCNSTTNDPFGILSALSTHQTIQRNMSANCFHVKTLTPDSNYEATIPDCIKNVNNVPESTLIKNNNVSTPNSPDLVKTSGNFLSRLATKRIRNRLVQKSGVYNVSLANVPKQKLKFFTDIFTTMIEMKWRWLLIIFTFSFLFSWLFFAAVYYLVMLGHGDFNDENLLNESWAPCISSVKNFLSLFLFSLETQHTIGYGSRFPSEKCPEVVVTLCVQSIFGLMIQTLLAGVVFAKLARPQKRAETLIFSKQACICMRDGKLCFLVRVGDMRKSHLAEAHIRLQLISKRMTNEGELLPFHQYEMNVGFESGLDRVFVVWPITICHVIDENSPLYECAAEDLNSMGFEVMAILEGVVQSGATMQARTSYLPSEILWGYRFEKLVTYQRENGKYRIDFSKFHKVYPVDIPTLSAKEIDAMKNAGLNVDEVYQCDDRTNMENSGLTPSESDHSFDKNLHEEASTAIQIHESHDEGEDEDTCLVQPCYNRQRRPSCLYPATFEAQDDLLKPEEIMKRHRKMSTMSYKLDKWLLPALEMTNAVSTKSLNSKLAASTTSLNNNVRKNSVLREHDMM